MKLIATLGATPAKFEHGYHIEDKRYSALFSFQSLQKHFNIDDENIIIVGTAKTKEVLGKFIASYRFEAVDENDLDAIFHKAVDLIEEGDIIDLTQSFRSIPFGVLLSLSFSKSLGKRPKDILYAQAEENTCNPVQNPCTFRFVSLKKYDEMTDLARSINTFNATLLVLDDINITLPTYQNLIKQLKKLSSAIYDNHFKKAKELAQKLVEDIDGALENKEYVFLQEHLKALKKELREMLQCDREHESERLLCWSRYLLSKDITLHSITTLFESMVAFLDEELNIQDCNEYKNRQGKKVKADTYKRRNCLKKKLKDCSNIKIPDCQRFSDMLKSIDELRNISAHAFANSSTSQNLTGQIEKTIDSLEKIYPKRYSRKSGIEKLEAVFGNR